MSNPTICAFVQLGQPRHLDLLKRNISYTCENRFFDEVVLVSSEKYLANELSCTNVLCIDLSVLENKFPEPVSDWRANFKPTLDQTFSNGFWRHTTERFFYLYLLALHRPDCLLVHVENDYFLQPDFSLDLLLGWIKRDIGGSLNRAYTCFDNAKGVAGFLIAPGPTALLPIVKAALRHPDRNDMSILQSLRGSTVRQLPNKPPDSIDDKFTAPIFDPNYLGQYLFGTDSLANPLRHEYRSDTRLFSNESAPIQVDSYMLELGRKNGFINVGWRVDGNRHPIFGLHVHAKSLHPWKKRSLMLEDIITGEAVQSMCDLTIVTQQKVYSLKTQKIQPKRVIVVSRDSPFPNPNDAAKIAKIVSSAKSIFLYGDCVKVFADVIQPFLQNPIDLYIHNSDEIVDPRCEPFVTFQKSPVLTKVFAQNLVWESGKFNGLPIGVANSNWAHGDKALVTSYLQSFIKTECLYVNFDIRTHSSRRDCFEATRRLPFATVRAGEQLSYDKYLSDIASHKFVLCPRGNGLDTHRFWESVYLGAVPVVMRSEVLPIHFRYDALLIDRWEDLTLEMMEQHYLEYFTSERSGKLPKLSEYFQNPNGAKEWY